MQSWSGIYTYTPILRISLRFYKATKAGGVFSTPPIDNYPQQCYNTDIHE